jgi:DNA processing protein
MPAVAVLSLTELVGGARRIGWPPGPTSTKRQPRLGFDEESGGVKVWCGGDVELARRPGVAIVGARNVSSEGARRARQLARDLARAGVVVVSGLARGVDTEALTAALEAGGRVIAVIGTPLDTAYPAENRHLQERIGREHLLISPFPPGQRVVRGNFPRRDRLMAEITDASVIIEASDASGALHQASECVRLGRWMFIARALMDDPALEWPRRFEKERTVKTMTETAEVLRVLPRG